MPDEGPRISDEAVEEATGKGWQAWFDLLDAWGAADKGHKVTAAYLAAEHDLSGWWSQMVTVAYERARGLRDVGETASGTYQVGVQRTFPVDPTTAWDAVLDGDGLSIWLGEGAPGELIEGETFTLDDGTTGEVRVVTRHSHVRLTWQPPAWEAPSTLQLRLVETGSGKIAVRFHHEELADEATREAMRSHWRSILDDLGDHLGPDMA